ncbi:MAG: peptidylprolyl isomerase [candidate division KSB1 bacterium]|nr:peptidylprolyl isomerase [candidate division KSB1 bacterium]MDZ7273495.1 peptidylprolyl isomerase [candidate division KSB1 bacterium]MDZ7286913.1 peptidylprolyl isomerase [candidate division KSB1 bacterium]MDZ7299734.1 peptidylprolyl isomerase [candidate division KSB1 bacterium]MDZ7305673.1 peptidylprolyl isomerase [candidate division KSB1 bacterium]
MMQRMRSYTKIFFYGLVAVFVGTIVFDWGMNVTGLQTRDLTIAKVNGENITITEFDRAVNQVLENYKDSGAEITDSQLNSIRNRVLDDLINSRLVRQEISKHNLSTTDKEITYYLFDQPPEFIQQMFRTEQGQFDMARYQAALKNPQLDQAWISVEQEMRNQLPVQKLQDMLFASVLVTESDIRSEYLARYQKATVRYAAFPWDKYRTAAVTISPQEIQKYYKEHQDDLKEPEKRKIDYVIFSTNPTRQDSQAVQDTAAAVYQRALAGEDFGKLAELYSEDESNSSKGGDLGFFPRGQMVKPFEEAAFAAKPGEIVGPVPTNFGLHIIKVEERKQENGEEKVRARHILLRYQASRATREAAESDARFFAEQARETSWNETVASEKVPAQTSTFFVKGSGFVPGLGLNYAASQFIFRNPVNTVSDPFETPQGFAVIRVAEIQKEHTKSLEEAKTQIETTLKEERWRQMAQQTAEKFYAALLQAGTSSFETLAQRDTIALQTPEPFTRAGFVSGVGRDQAFIGTAFSLQPMEISKPVKGLRGSYLIQLLSRDEFNQADYNDKKEDLRNQLTNRARQQAFEQWLAALKKDADIEDKRERFF